VSGWDSNYYLLKCCDICDVLEGVLNEGLLGKGYKSFWFIGTKSCAQTRSNNDHR
jgi:hypothetical protein